MVYLRVIVFTSGFFEYPLWVLYSQRYLRLIIFLTNCNRWRKNLCSFDILTTPCYEFTSKFKIIFSKYASTGLHNIIDKFESWDIIRCLVQKSIPGVCTNSFYEYIIWSVSWVSETIKSSQNLDCMSNGPSFLHTCTSLR